MTATTATPTVARDHTAARYLGPRGDWHDYAIKSASRGNTEYVYSINEVTGEELHRCPAFGHCWHREAGQMANWRRKHRAMFRQHPTDLLEAYADEYRHETRDTTREELPLTWATWDELQAELADRADNVVGWGDDAA